MGDGCSPKNLPATLIAYNQAKGMDLFSEASRVIQMDGEQRAYYEDFMASEYGISPKKTGKSRWDILKERSKKGSDPSAIDDRLYIRPSEQFSQKFYGSIDKKITAWSKGKNPDKASYNEQVGKPVREVIKAIDAIAETTKTASQMNAKLKRMGLTADTVYDARSYLDWLSEGGHLKSQGDAKPLIQQAGTIAKAQAAFNLKWTLGNGVDMLRVGSYYLTQPGGIKNTVKGLYQAAAATKGNPFRRIAELDKKGIYGSQYVDRGGANLNPFEWSITAQKNITYHLDKAAGGDGERGIRELLFDSKPWDRPRYDRFEGSGLVAGLARYPINETRWLYKTSRAVLANDKRAAANLGLYFLSRAAFTGTASLIPSFVWQAMPKDMKDSITEWEKKTGQNLIKQASSKVFHAMGLKANIDLTEYLQPQVPLLGSRAQSIGQTAESGLKTGAKTAIDLGKGKIPAAAANAAATALALANFGLLTAAAAKFAPAATATAEALQGGTLNSTTITKLMSVTGEELEKEFKADRYKLNVVKAAFGQTTIKKDKAASGNGLPELPALPELPQVR